MNDEFHHFEQKLRRVSPASCDHLKDVAMYRAGWNAAQAVIALRSQTVSPKRKSIATFATGLMCGVVCCGVGLTAWQFHPIAHNGLQDSVVGTKEIIPPIAAIVNVPAAVDDATVKQQEMSLNSFSTVLMPWLKSSDVSSLDFTPLAAKPLSVAARRQWSQMLLSDFAVPAVHRATNEISADDQPEYPLLRTRPLWDMNLNDLL